MWIAKNREELVAQSQGPEARGVWFMKERRMGKGERGLGVVFCVGFAFLAGGLLGCDYARMKDQESVRTYETQLPSMPSGTVPIEGGVLWISSVDRKEIPNPLKPEPQNLQRGREAFKNFCSMCHGLRGDGRGTVGQSFHPLPTDLRSQWVQALSDGELFKIISLGSRRSPPLAHTISEEDRWAIVLHIRALVGT
jgi:mono/diheme cytochrome c family protein